MTEEEMKSKITKAHTDGYNRGYAKAEEKIKQRPDIEDEFFRELFNFIDWLAPDRAKNVLFTQLLICIQDKFYSMQKENAELEQQIEKMKNGDNCKYGCIACGNYICELGLDCNAIPFHCDKWELKND